VDEEESFVAAIEKFWKPYRASGAEAVLIEQYPVTRSFAGLRISRQVTIVEPVVGIEPWVAVVLVDAAVKIVRSLASDELDRYCAQCSSLSLRRGRGNGDFLHGVEAWGDTREEAVCRFIEVILNVDAIQRDINRAGRQAVDSGVAILSWRVDTSHQDDEVERIAGD